MYPLTPDYEQPIIDFIHRLRSFSEVTVATNGLSTQLTGEYDAVMAAITEALRPSMAAETTISVVIKVLNVGIDPGASVEV